MELKVCLLLSLIFSLWCSIRLEKHYKQIGIDVSPSAKAVADLILTNLKSLKPWSLCVPHEHHRSKRGTEGTGPISKTIVDRPSIPRYTDALFNQMFSKMVKKHIYFGSVPLEDAHYDFKTIIDQRARFDVTREAQSKATRDKNKQTPMRLKNIKPENGVIVFSNDEAGKTSYRTFREEVRTNLKNVYDPNSDIVSGTKLKSTLSFDIIFITGIQSDFPTVTRSIEPEGLSYILYDKTDEVVMHTECKISKDNSRALSKTTFKYNAVDSALLELLEKSFSHPLVPFSHKHIDELKIKRENIYNEEVTHARQTKAKLEADKQKVNQRISDQSTTPSGKAKLDRQLVKLEIKLLEQEMYIVKFGANPDGQTNTDAIRVKEQISNLERVKEEKEVILKGLIELKKLDLQKDSAVQLEALQTGGNPQPKRTLDQLDDDIENLVGKKPTGSSGSGCDRRRRRRAKRCSGGPSVSPQGQEKILRIRSKKRRFMDKLKEIFSPKSHSTVEADGGRIQSGRISSNLMDETVQSLKQGTFLDSTSTTQTPQFWTRVRVGAKTLKASIGDKIKASGQNFLDAPAAGKRGKLEKVGRGFKIAGNLFLVKNFGQAISNGDVGEIGKLVGLTSLDVAQDVVQRVADMKKFGAATTGRLLLAAKVLGAVASAADVVMGALSLKDNIVCHGKENENTALCAVAHKNCTHGYDVCGGRDTIVSIVTDSISIATSVVIGISSIVFPPLAAVLAIGSFIFNFVVGIFQGAAMVKSFSKIIPFAESEAHVQRLRAAFGFGIDTYYLNQKKQQELNLQVLDQMREFLLNQSNTFSAYIKSAQDSPGDAPNINNRPSHPTELLDSWVMLHESDYRHRYFKRWTPNFATPVGGTVKKFADFTFMCRPQVEPGDPVFTESHLYASSYFCKNAIGLQGKNTQTDDNRLVLIDLGQGKDTAYGFENRPNLFMVGGGVKNYHGGNKNDIFMLSTNSPSGTLDGQGGNNSLEMADCFHPHRRLFIKVGSQGVQHLTDESTNSMNLLLSNMMTISGRKYAEYLQVACHNTQIDLKRAQSLEKMDWIDISQSCAYDLRIQVQPFTMVVNKGYGSFKYVFPGRAPRLIHLRNTSRGFRNNFSRVDSLKRKSVVNILHHSKYLQSSHAVYLSGDHFNYSTQNGYLDLSMQENDGKLVTTYESTSDILQISVPIVSPGGSVTLFLGTENLDIYMQHQVGVNYTFQLTSPIIFDKGMSGVATSVVNFGSANSTIKIGNEIEGAVSVVTSGDWQILKLSYSYRRGWMKLRNVKEILGRMKKQDIVEAACSNSLINLQGGLLSEVDEINIKMGDCKYALYIVLTPLTRVVNIGTSGSFVYMIPFEQIETLIELELNTMQSSAHLIKIENIDTNNLSGLHLKVRPDGNYAQMKTLDVVSESKFNVSVSLPLDEIRRNNVTISIGETIRVKFYKNRLTQIWEPVCEFNLANQDPFANVTVSGTLKSPNYFLINGAYNQVIGGEESDTFVLLSKANILQGLVGNSVGKSQGYNRLSLSDNFEPNSICTINVLAENFSCCGEVVNGEGKNIKCSTTSMIDFNDFTGRENQLDKLIADCTTESIDLKGGWNNLRGQDVIFFPNLTCQFSSKLALQPNSAFLNGAIVGEFLYQVPTPVLWPEKFTVYNAKESLDITQTFQLVDVLLSDILKIEVNLSLTRIQLVLKSGITGNFEFATVDYSKLEEMFGMQQLFHHIQILDFQTDRLNEEDAVPLAPPTLITHDDYKIEVDSQGGILITNRQPNPKSEDELLRFIHKNRRIANNLGVTIVTILTTRDGGETNTYNRAKRDLTSADSAGGIIYFGGDDEVDLFTNHIYFDTHLVANTHGGTNQFDINPPLHAAQGPKIFIHLNPRLELNHIQDDDDVDPEDYSEFVPQKNTVDLSRFFAQSLVGGLKDEWDVLIPTISQFGQDLHIHVHYESVTSESNANGTTKNVLHGATQDIILVDGTKYHDYVNVILYIGKYQIMKTINSTTTDPEWSLQLLPLVLDYEASVPFEDIDMGDSSDYNEQVSIYSMDDLMEYNRQQLPVYLRSDDMGSMDNSLMFQDNDLVLTNELRVTEDRFNQVEDSDSVSSLVLLDYKKLIRAGGLSVAINGLTDEKNGGSQIISNEDVDSVKELKSARRVLSLKLWFRHIGYIILIGFIVFLLLTTVVTFLKSNRSRRYLLNCWGSVRVVRKEYTVTSKHHIKYKVEEKLLKPEEDGLKLNVHGIARAARQLERQPFICRVYMLNTGLLRPELYSKELLE